MASQLVCFERPADLSLADHGALNRQLRAPRSDHQLRVRDPARDLADVAQIVATLDRRSGVALGPLGLLWGLCWGLR